MTVWYNPDESTAKKLSTYSSHFKTVFVIDNSEKDNSNLLVCAKVLNVIYIPNYKNLGIASALNIGCEKALTSGFDWILTMDQDSWWDEEAIISYINQLKQITNIASPDYDDKIVSIEANSNAYPVHSLVSLFLRKLKLFRDKALPEKQFVDRCITSGNFIKLDTWKKVGKFKEELFIDEVDHEYCYRLRLSNYKILLLNTIPFHHHLGEPKTTLFPKPHTDTHNTFRLYYMIRNELYIMKKYPEIAKKFEYQKKLTYLYKQYCTGIFNKEKKKNREIFAKAKTDIENIK